MSNKIDHKLDHVLIMGPPGAGKTMWARRQAQRWPFPQKESAADRSYIYHVAGMQVPGLNSGHGNIKDYPPFRAPHHTVSRVAMTGKFEKDYRWRPGELNLAHGGTLFIDEAPEFRRDVLKRIIHAAKTGVVTHESREARIAVPTRFRLVAAMNPCPCGWHGVADNQTQCSRTCSCTQDQVTRYMKRVEDLLKICRLIPAAEWQAELKEMVAREGVGA